MHAATAIQIQRKLIEATRGQFQKYYETELTDADCLEIADNLTAYSNILRDIAASPPYEAISSPTKIPVTFPQIAQVSTVDSPLTFPKTGQLK
jgi:hypothetical protein